MAALYFQSILKMPDLNDFRTALGRHAAEVGVSAAAKAFGVTPRVALYWCNKYQDPEFHALSHGGRRNVKFPPEVQYELESSLWGVAKEHPCWSLKEFTNALQNLDFDVNSEFVRVIFKSWRWSWKKSDSKQPQKYSLANLNYTIDFVLWLRTIPFARLKFLDESHFNSSDFQSRRKFVGPIKSKPSVKAVQGMTKSYSVTLLTSLSPITPGPFFIKAREKSNTAYDFLEFLCDAAEAGFLHPGDVLICDNATVHTAVNIQELLLRVIDEWGVEIKFLPTYSPELNPCELVFALVKKLLRSKISADDFLAQICQYFTHLTPEMLRNFYRHCIDFLFVHGLHVPPGAI